ncbi:MAG: iron uptake transporter permease EfeU [Anaerolineales bacterium]
MAAATLISLREGLEAALIVGILLGYLRKIDHPAGRGPVWIGVLAAVILSVGVAVVIQTVGLELEGSAEQIFEGTTMFLAVGVLTWMIFWMRYQARLMRSSLEQDVQAAVAAGRNRGLAAVSFVAVLREGVETALFLSAAAFASNDGGTLAGAVLGLGLAALIGYLIYATTARLNVRIFFNLTSVLLLIFAAGLFAHGVHEFQEAGVFPTLNAQLWNTNHILDESSTVGEFLKALIGYNGNPSLEEVAAYLVYWVATLLGVRLWMQSKFATRLKPA